MNVNKNQGYDYVKETKRRYQLQTIKDIGTLALMGAGYILVAAAIGFGINMYNNDDVSFTKSRQTISWVTGIMAHESFTSFNDGSHQVNMTDGMLWNRSMKVYEDSCGNLKPKKITTYGMTFGNPTIDQILVAGADNDPGSIKEFVEGEKQMRRLHDRFIRRQLLLGY